ncbi:MAG: M48 family metalloprotease [Algoriphagus sp.]|nr:M48 family metalloprotease [Algoriphagus sp.]
MKLLNDWIPAELLKALGWTLVHSIWQLILAATLLWLVLKLIKNKTPALKYGMAVGLLILSFGGVIGTFIYQLSQTGVSSEFEGAFGEIIWVYQGQANQQLTWESILAKGTFWIESNLLILVNFWFFGALMFLFKLLNSLSEIRNLRKNASLLEDFEVIKMAHRLVGKLGVRKEVEFRTSTLIQSPLTFGTIKPVILLPTALIFQLSTAQLEAIIAHELAHVKRNDYLSNLLLSGLEILFFFHPCYWWMSQTVKELRENAADDLALKAGIQPKVLATSLAEVLNFAKQNPPDLALAASKKRNPTLLRIKRMLGYETENYPQTSIISIPMLLTLFLSAGLMASAQQDAPKSEFKNEKSAAIQSRLEIAPAWDTIPTSNLRNSKIENHRISITTEDGKTYHIIGDKMISGKDTLAISNKVRLELEKLMQFDAENMPELIIPDAPEFDHEWIAPAPDYDLDIPLPPDPIEPPFESFEFENFSTWNFSFGDTSKMSKEERERWRKEIELMAKEGANHAEKMSKEWEKKWRENESSRREKMAEWEAKFQQEFQPKLKEFEQKMKAWQEANEPKIKEFESKMKAWQEAQEPKMREFELKMKEWEAAHKPKMEEFQRKMEAWQKEHQVKMEELQKLLKEEFQKEKDKN